MESQQFIRQRAEPTFAVEEADGTRTLRNENIGGRIGAFGVYEKSQVGGVAVADIHGYSCFVFKSFNDRADERFVSA